MECSHSEAKEWGAWTGWISMIMTMCHSRCLAVRAVHLPPCAHGKLLGNVGGMDQS